MMNISIFEMLTAHMHYWIDFTKMLMTVRKTYEDSFGVLVRVLKQEFPVTAVLKNGKCISLRTFNAMFFIAYTQDIPEIRYDVDNDVVIIPSKESGTKKEIKLYGGVNNGDIVYGFLKGDYGNLPILDKTIIDIGSNIGDTPIYFATHGAKRVIGLEPFPNNYELAKKNIVSNDLSEKITLILAGCSSAIGEIIINPKHESNIESRLVESNKGMAVSLLTLQDIIKKYEVPNDSVLKMDCEGCEYESIIHTPNTVLQRFSNIQIEYHSGYKNLKTKLEECGFKVTISKPKATDVINTYVQYLKNLRPSKKKQKMDNFAASDMEPHFKKHHQIGYAGFIHATK